jgi:hypothetical protein
MYDHRIPFYASKRDPSREDLLAILDQLHNNREYVFVGVDPGQTGGMFIQRADPTPGEPEGWFANWNTLGPSGMRDIIEMLPSITLHACVEQVLISASFQGSKSTVFAQGQNCGWWDATLAYVRIRFDYVTAKTWQKSVCPNLVVSRSESVTYTDWKRQLAAAAISRFPMSYLKQSAADAALISERARIVWNNSRIGADANELQNAAEPATRRVSRKARKNKETAG